MMQEEVLSMQSSLPLIRRFFALLCAFALLLPARVSLAAADRISGIYTIDAILYIPDFQSAEFQEKRVEGIEVSTRAPLEKTLLTLLLEEIAESVPENYSILRDLSLLSPGYIQSRTTALIHLSGEALQLDPLSRFTLCQAITNTICAPGQIKACLIMSDGKALSLDEAQTIPTGVFAPNEYSDPLAAMSQLLLRHTESETADLHYRANTALFYPTSAGHGVICEVKALTYASDDTPEAAVRTIISGLSDSGMYDVPRIPLLNDFLIADPVLEKTDDGESIMVLRFDVSLSNTLSENGILRSTLMAALTMSLQGYFPWISGVRCEIGGEPILAIVPVGLLDGANEAISFERGYMMWQDFAHFMLTDVSLYFVNDGGELSETHRYIPSEWAFDPQRLIDQLNIGPSYYDSVTELKGIFDETDLSEILSGITAAEHQIILDFKEPAWISADNLSSEQNAVYAIVNTLTQLQWCRRVLITVNGSAPHGMLSYVTPFMRSMDYRR